ncbi:MAG TPA: hypothetical protein VGE29_08140 [Prosthecobacter sp.]
MTVLAIGSLLVGAIGAGLSYYSSNQQAAAQERISNLNFQAQMQSANQQMELSKLQYDTNQKLYKQQVDQQENNALAMRDQADAADRAARDNASRTRGDYERMKAAQRARMAKSGIAEAGTPLDVLAETAGEMALAVATETYQSRQESAKTRFMADVEDANASLTQFQGVLQGFSDQSAIARARGAMTGAQIDRLVGLNAARQSRMAGAAALFSGIGGMANSGYDFYRSGAFTP